METSAAQSPPMPCPLESLKLPPELDGSIGSNRAQGLGLQIPAQTDKQAIELFLAEFDHSPGTQRIYRRECERLLLWSVLRCTKALSSLNRQDLENYTAFLTNPVPRALWCGPRAGRETGQWRPFVGPLSESACLTSLAAVNSLFKWLCDAGYLQGNPLGLIRQKRKSVQSQLVNVLGVERYLDQEMWAAVLNAAQALPSESEKAQCAKERIRYVLSFLYLLAPRAADLNKHSMGSFIQMQGLWWWQVQGKGRKHAKVAVPQDMLTALMRYRQFLGLSAVPRRDERTPLLMSLANMSRIRKAATESKATALELANCAMALTDRQLNRVLKSVFALAADLLGEHQADKRQALLRASAHWGRHTSITAKVIAGMDTRHVQKDARHSDARTTALYTHEEDKAWHADAQKLTLGWASPKEVEAE